MVGSNNAALSEQRQVDRFLGFLTAYIVELMRVLDLVREPVSKTKAGLGRWLSG